MDVDPVRMIAVADLINGVVIAVAGSRLLTDWRSKERDGVIRHTARSRQAM